MLSNESSTAPDAAIYRQSGHLGYCLCSTDARLPLTSSVHPLEDWWKGRLKVWEVKSGNIKILEVKGSSSIPYSKNGHMLPKARSESSHNLDPKLSQSCSNDVPMSSQISLQVVSKLPPVLSQSCKVVSKLFPMLSKRCLKIVVPGGLQFSWMLSI